MGLYVRSEAPAPFCILCSCKPRARQVRCGGERLLHPAVYSRCEASLQQLYQPMLIGFPKATNPNGFDCPLHYKASILQYETIVLVQDSTLKPTLSPLIQRLGYNCTTPTRWATNQRAMPGAGRMVITGGQFCVCFDGNHGGSVFSTCTVSRKCTNQYNYYLPMTVSLRLEKFGQDPVECFLFQLDVCLF